MTISVKPVLERDPKIQSSITIYTSENIVSSIYKNNFSFSHSQVTTTLPYLIQTRKRNQYTCRNALPAHMLDD